MQAHFTSGDQDHLQSLQAEFDINKLDYLNANEAIIFECHNCVKTVSHRMLDHDDLPVLEFDKEEDIDISIQVSNHLVAEGNSLRD